MARRPSLKRKPRATETPDGPVPGPVGTDPCADKRAAVDALIQRLDQHVATMNALIAALDQESRAMQATQAALQLAQSALRTCLGG